MPYGRGRSGYRVAKITGSNWKDRYPDRSTWNEMRSQIIVEKRCSRCGCKPTKDNPIQAGHRVPLSKGGRNTLLNLGEECKRCNDKKRDRKPTHFKGRRK